MSDSTKLTLSVLVSMYVSWRACQYDGMLLMVRLPKNLRALLLLPDRQGGFGLVTISWLLFLIVYFFIFLFFVVALQVLNIEFMGLIYGVSMMVWLVATVIDGIAYKIFNRKKRG